MEKWLDIKPTTQIKLLNGLKCKNLIEIKYNKIPGKMQLTRLIKINKKELKEIMHS